MNAVKKFIATINTNNCAQLRIGFAVLEIYNWQSKAKLFADLS